MDKDRLQSVNKLIETIQHRSKENHTKLGYISERMRNNLVKVQNNLTQKIYENLL